ncbi:hypothetical protein SAMN05216419_100847 [Nitrosomonas cryotolerans]|uniref:N-acetyltransferase domain-containing protein n=2 Tax=Nitrosomonas cryotolerans TaxID=44575 RepID=A0A1N6I3Q5_9PROT|nr:hypothetical protein [Nitrosomonas cryotolerans]SFP59398.1 hypothetical protein SAMN05216419_100847 [Nitrosomonas cryotolerans]SIO26611.1 hypothetical protein SAMN02743940_1520 [Nitrosomonas cryotolerans ATCC 49181]
MLPIQKIYKSLTAFIKINLKRIIPINRIHIDSLIDLNRLLLFSWTPSEMPPFKPRPDLEIRKLTRKDFSALMCDSGRFSEQAKRYYLKRGIETAYGAYIDGELVHISWVYTAAEYSKEPFQRLALENHEAEIVNCFTLEKCRGFGIYPYAIQFLSNLQFQNGMKRVYMMADHKNYASQRGIIKAGLKPLGRVTYIRFPATSSRSIYYRRHQN